MNGAGCRVALAVLLSFCGILFAQSHTEPASIYTTRDYEEDLRRISSYTSSLTRPNLLSAISELDKKWAARDADYHAMLMWAACHTIQVYHPLDSTLTNLARKVVGNVSNLPAGTAMLMLIELHNYAYGNPKDATESVNYAEARAWLSTWDRMRQVLLEEETNTVPRVVTVDPPLPAGLKSGFSGMPPEAIEDPVLRAQYIKIILKRQQEGRRGEQVRSAIDRSEWFKRTAESRIAQVFRALPDKQSKLQKVLDEFPGLLTAEERTRILAAVNSGY